MKRTLLLLIILPLLISCARKIPVTSYANYGWPCTNPLVIGGTISWEEGTYTGVLAYNGVNMRHTGFTVNVREGSIITVTGSGTCCCDADGEPVEYFASSSETIKGGVFSKPHYYVVYYMGGGDEDNTGVATIYYE